MLSALQSEVASLSGVNIYELRQKSEEDQAELGETGLFFLAILVLPVPAAVLTRALPRRGGEAVLSVSQTEATS